MSQRHAPLKTKQAFERRLTYIAQNGLVLGQLVLGREVPIDTVTIFSQTDQEYAKIAGFIRNYGPVSAVSHGDTLYIDTSFELLSNLISYLGVRKPDPTRPEVGYVDFPVSDFTHLVSLCQESSFMQLITSGRGQPLIEIRHPNFDVRGYIVATEEHS